MTNRDRESTLLKLKAEFRGILLSAGRNGLTVRELMRDYQDLNGRPIPLADLGYYRIEELLDYDMVDVCSVWVNDATGEVTLYPMTHESTRHIESLIARQRPAKTGRFGGSLPQMMAVGRSVEQPRQQMNRRNPRFNYRAAPQPVLAARMPPPRTVRMPAPGPMRMPSPRTMRMPTPSSNVASRSTVTSATYAANVLPSPSSNVAYRTPVATTSSAENVLQSLPTNVAARTNVATASSAAIVLPSPSSSVTPSSAVVASASSATMGRPSPSSILAPRTIVATASSTAMVMPSPSSNVESGTAVANATSATMRMPSPSSILAPRTAVSTALSATMHMPCPSSSFTPGTMFGMPSSSSVAPGTTFRTALSASVRMPSPSLILAPRTAVGAASSAAMIMPSPTSSAFSLTTAAAAPSSSSWGFAPPTAVAPAPSVSSIPQSSAKTDKRKKAAFVEMPKKNLDQYDEVRRNVTKLMEKYSKRGIDVGVFKAAYENCFNRRINVQDLFDMSWQELLSGMTDICCVDENGLVKPGKGIPRPPAPIKPPDDDASLEKLAAKSKEETRKWINQTTTAASEISEEETRQVHLQNRPPPVATKTRPSVDIVPFNYVYPSTAIPVQQTTIPVVILQCNSPDDFYLQLQSQLREMMELMKELEEFDFAKRTDLAVKPADLKVGLCAVGNVIPMGWHRVVVEEIVNNEIKCRCVDFGTLDVILLENLRHLPNYFGTWPAQACRAKLAIICPIKDDTYSQEAGMTIFEKASKSNVWMEIVPEETTPNHLSVILTAVESGTDGLTDVHLNDELIKLGLAKFRDESLNREIANFVAGVHVAEETNGVSNGEEDNVVLCDDEFRFTPEEREQPKADAIDWEAELENMAEDNEDSSSVREASITSVENDVEQTVQTPPQFIGLETEIALMDQARKIMTGGATSLESLHIIRTVLAMKRVVVQKELLASAGCVPAGLVDKLTHLEAEIKYLDDYTVQFQVPNVPRM